MPTADHSAWQATWNDDERLLADTPSGYWHSLVVVSQVKRVLLGELPPDLRLRFLEILTSRFTVISRSKQCSASSPPATRR